MKKRHVCLLGLGAAWTAGAFLLACGSSGGSFTDGGADSSADATMDRMMSTFDGHLPDSSQPQPDVIGSDAKKDGGGSDAPFDSGLVGNCSPVNGPACDIVKQNCPAGKECVIFESADAAIGFITACAPTQSSEHLPVGSKCCPNAASNPCDKGLTCIGASCVADAGGGRCSPACCPAGDGGAPSENCGTSPEGYLGQCDITITEGAVSLFTACTYSAKCVPLDIGCSAGNECSLENEGGAFDCTLISGPDGGSTGSPAGGSCNTSSNECQDGTVCIGLASGNTCLYYCYAGGTTPFDAGVLNGTVGHGGCPTGNTCEGVTGFPAWLGVCVPP